MIPKKLHFIWVGDENKRPNNCIDTWIQHNTGWHIKIWGNSSLIEKKWVNAHHMQEIAKFELNGLADLMRWEILYDEGGILVDADSICVRPLEEHFLDNEAFACWENEVARPGLIAAGYFGCHAGNAFVGQIINDIFSEESVTNEMAWKTVGPQRLTDSYRKYNYQSLKIFPSHFFIPEHFSGVVYNGHGDIYAYQEWASTRNSYDELHLKPISEIGRSLSERKISKKLVASDATEPPPADKDRRPNPIFSNDSITAHHSLSFIQKINVSSEIIGLHRLEVFSKLCQGQRVLHIGCADRPINDEKQSLHLSLQPFCAKLDGFDVNKDSFSLQIENIKGNIYTRYEDICDEYDLILVPEVMAYVPDVKELLTQLDSLNAPSIIITVPDAYQCSNKNFEYSEHTSSFIEIVHPELNFWFMPYTLSNSINKYTNWRIEGIWFLNGVSLMMLLKK